MSNVQIPKYSSELCSSSIAMLATVTQILPVPDSFKLLEIIYGYKFDCFFIFILRFQKTIMYPLSFRSFLRFESRALHID